MKIDVRIQGMGAGFAAAAARLAEAARTQARPPVRPTASDPQGLTPSTETVSPSGSDTGAPAQG